MEHCWLPLYGLPITFISYFLFIKIHQEYIHRQTKCVVGGLKYVVVYELKCVVGIHWEEAILNTIY